MLNVGSAGYKMGLVVGSLPSAYDLYVEHALLHDDFDSAGSEGEAAFITIKRSTDEWPRLVVSLRHSNVPSFDLGLHVADETGLLLIGDFRRLIAYDLNEPQRLWIDETCSGFRGWERHADVIVMSAELDIAAYSLRGELLWTRFVEPPWSYTIIDDRIRLDVMGDVFAFPLHTGPVAQEAKQK